MPKINPFALARPIVGAKETKQFTDPAQPGQEFSLTLRGLDVPEQLALSDRFAEWTKKYVGSDTEPADEEFPPVGDKKVQMSSDLVAYAGTVFIQQCGPDEETYTFEQVIALAVQFPNAWQKVQKWSNRLNTPKGKKADTIPPTAGS